jgi:hypothetical protein
MDNGFHKFCIWAINSVPFFAVFVCWIALLSTGEFIDGIQGVNCKTSVDLVASPQTIWNKAGCVIKNVSEIIPSRKPSNTP